MSIHQRKEFEKRQQEKISPSSLLTLDHKHFDQVKVKVVIKEKLIDINNHLEQAKVRED